MHAQSDSANSIYILATKFNYTSIITENSSLEQFTHNHPWSAQIDFGVLKNNQKAWNYCNCYSQNGLSVGYINFDNPDKLGKAFTLSTFIEPYLFFNKRFQLSLRGSGGLAFLNKVYESISNKQSIFFSTKMSFFLSAGLNFSYRINENLNFKTFAQFNHISNGGRRDPNEGMNFPGVGIGIDYNLSPQKLQRRKNQKFPDKSISLVVHTFGNIRTAWADVKWPEERRLLIGTNVGLIKRIGRLNGIGAGGEFYYDGINDVYNQRSGQTVQTTLGAVSIQHNFFFGRLLLGQQLAWYVTPNNGFQTNIYQRYLIEYELMKNWYSGVSLKAHGNHSDYFSFSIGHIVKL